MVFGNLGDDSGTGVAFTRNPSTGEKKFYGEFLVNAQGEDVVAGIRTPLAHRRDGRRGCPGAYAELLETQERLEQHYRDMQDIEFTVERGKLYLLQTRTGKRTAAAAVRIARDMVDEGLIDAARGRAARRRRSSSTSCCIRSSIPACAPTPICDRAARESRRGERQSPCSIPTSPSSARADGDARDSRARRDDARGFSRHRRRARGAHRARRHDEPRRRRRARHGQVRGRRLQGHRRRSSSIAASRSNGTTIAEGDWITLDGATGTRLRRRSADDPERGRAACTRGTLRALGRAPSYQSYARLLGWADEVRTLRVRANADTPHDARIARSFGAEGIGLCRTEHMFFEGDRITRDARDDRRARRGRTPSRAREAAADAARATSKESSRRWTASRSRSGCSIRRCTSSFRTAARRASCSRARSASPRDELKRIVESLRETNPMLGHRGCRLGITYPGDHRDAGARDLRGGGPRQAARHRRAAGDHGPAGVDGEGVRATSARSSRTSREQVLGAMGEEVPYTIGTMIELPRAALTADEIATAGGVLLLRHKRPHADDIRPEPRRCRALPSDVRRVGHFPRRSLPGARHCGRRAS